MKEIQTERKTDCFAYNAESDRCSALTAISCNKCAFYKSEEQMRDELMRISARLADLQTRKRRAKGE